MQCQISVGVTKKAKHLLGFLRLEGGSAPLTGSLFFIRVRREAFLHHFGVLESNDLVGLGEGHLTEIAEGA